MRLNKKKILMLGGAVAGGVLLFNWWSKRKGAAIPPASAVAKKVSATVPKVSTKQTVINAIVAEPGVKAAISELGQGAAGFIKNIFSKVTGGGDDAPATPDQKA